MQCQSSCNLANQLLWATQMEAWYRDKPLTEYLTSIDLTGPLPVGAQAATPRGFKNGTYSYLFWRNVDEASKNDYFITAEALNGLYPGKPYFIVYSAKKY